MVLCLFLSTKKEGHLCRFLSVKKAGRKFKEKTLNNGGIVLNVKVKGIAKNLFCLLLIIILASGNILSMASVVKVPTFTSAVNDVTLQMGGTADIEVCAALFDGEGQIRYTLQVLRGSSFMSDARSVVGGSGETAVLTVSANSNDLLGNTGIYTARIKGEALDEKGEPLGDGYSAAFEISVVPSLITSVYAESPMFASGEMAVICEINEEYADKNAEFYWTVSDDNGNEITDSEYRGISFSGKNSAALKISGAPEGVFALTFTVNAACGDLVSVSDGVTVELRPEEAFGFVFDGTGIKYYSLGSLKMLTGWQRPVDVHGVYYFDPATGYMVTGTKEVEGNICCFGADGRLIKGFTRTPGGVRYFENGAPVYKLRTIDGTAYYFDDITGYAVKVPICDQ